MEIHQREFAEIDVCPKCGGAFFDAGEGASVHGASAEAGWLANDGLATKQGRSAIRCPAHAVETAQDYRAQPKTMPAADAPFMDLYLVGDGEVAVEVDLCPECGGFFLDPGEGIALLELAGAVSEEIVTESGAVFAAPPPDGDAPRAAVQGARDRSLFSELARGVFQRVLRERRGLGAFH